MPQYPDGIVKCCCIFIFRYITGKPYQISQIGFVNNWVLTSYTHVRRVSVELRDKII